MNLYILVSLFILSIFSIHCTGIPVLSETVTARMQYVLKGTYESNNPYDWAKIYTDDYISTNLPNSGSIHTAVNINDVKIFLDIAETTLSAQTPAQYKDIGTSDRVQFALQRQLLCSNTKALDGTSLTGCENSDGINKINNFFKEGITYPSSDVSVKQYNSLVVILRRMLISPAYSYSGSNYTESNLTDSFDNRVVNGINLRQFYDYQKNDNSADIFSRFFHIYRNDLNLAIPNDRFPYVLEVRVFIKNLLMKHIRVNKINSTDISAVSFIGPSDWLENYDYSNDSTNIINPSLNNRIGGTILMGARIYKPNEVASLTINNFTQTCGTGIKYFAAIKANEIFDTKKLPIVATQVSNPAVLKNMSPGLYDVYITQDKTMLSNEGIINGEDGFPETIKKCFANINLLINEVKTVDASSCECP